MAERGDASIRIHAAAGEELRNATRHYLERDPRVADRFVNAIDRALAMIEGYPDRWPEFLFGTRRFVLREFPFVVVYRPTPRGIRVVAIAHMSRKPGYWKRRK